MPGSTRGLELVSGFVYMKFQRAHGKGGGGAPQDGSGAGTVLEGLGQELEGVRELCGPER